MLSFTNFYHMNISSKLIMNLQREKIFLCVVVVLTICQYARSKSTNTDGNVTYIKYIGDSIIYKIINKNNYNHVTTNIAGGAFAKLGQYPYMAVVHGLVGKGRIAQCGGTIISKRWVLTAGHCVVAGYPRRFHVVFGIINKSGVGYDWLRGPGVSMIATEAFLHSRYRANVNDIALLHMPRDIPFSATIQPIKLANYNYKEKVLANRNANIIGWGKDNNTSYGTTNLKFATLPIITNYECKRYWNITNKHICTAPGLGRDVCQGDSGGPLIIKENGQDIQVGIASYGSGQCPGNESGPGVFTRVSPFIGWIRGVMDAYNLNQCFSTFFYVCPFF